MSMSTIRKSTRVRKLTGKQLDLQQSQTAARGNSRPGTASSRDGPKTAANDGNEGTQVHTATKAFTVSNRAKGDSGNTSNSYHKNTEILTNTLGHNNSCKRPQESGDSQRPAKLQKLEVKPVDEDNDRLDPVEKLLSLNYINQDMNADDAASDTNGEEGSNLETQMDNGINSDNIDEEEDEYDDTEDSEADYNNDINKYNQISLNFTKILNDNLLKHYSSFNRSPIDFYNNNSSFALLNKHPYPSQHNYYQQPRNLDSPTSNSTTDESNVTAPNNQANTVPFFKAVNFNPKPKTHIFDEIITLDDEIDPKDNNCNDDNKNDAASEEPISPIRNESVLAGEISDHINADDMFYSNTNNNVSDSDDELTTPKSSPLLTNSKMCFHYRQHDYLNLSNLKPQPSNLRILNENSILSGKASETIGSGNFLINDFFL